MLWKIDGEALGWRLRPAPPADALHTTSARLRSAAVRPRASGLITASRWRGRAARRITIVIHRGRTTRCVVSHRTGTIVSPSRAANGTRRISRVSPLEPRMASLALEPGTPRALSPRPGVSAIDAQARPTDYPGESYTNSQDKRRARRHDPHRSARRQCSAV